MIKLEFVLTDNGKTGAKKRMKIASQPDYEDIYKDMFSVFYAMYDSLLDIRRVETNVFPLLILKHEYL